MNNVTPYYFAYGFNTERDGMSRRCPDAVSLGAATLNNYRFRFCYHADIVPDRNNVVHGVLWRTTPQCIESLDRVEGYPTYYGRRLVDVLCDGVPYSSWVYYMQGGYTDSLPSQYYLEQLQRGYSEHGVSVRQLEQALVAAERVDYGLDQYSDVDQGRILRELRSIQ